MFRTVICFCRHLQAELREIHRTNILFLTESGLTVRGQKVAMEASIQQK